jgi:gliding motility-associated-like protein
MCEGTTITYSTEANKANYMWNISSGGMIVSGEGTDVIDVLWTTAGYHTLSVNYANEFGCMASTPVTYTVEVYPTPQPPVVGSYASCPTTGTLAISTMAKSNEGVIRWYASATGGSAIIPGIIRKNIPIDTTLYASARSNNGCESPRSAVRSQVFENPDITDIDMSDLHNIQVIVEKGTTPYRYIETNKEGEFYGVADLGLAEFGLHEFFVTDANGCKADTMFTIDPIPLIPDKFTTPNGDGNNNVWYVQNIEFYPRTEIYIHDRFGKELIRYKGADFRGWDGMYKGNPMPTTDYWYVIQIRETGKRMVGHFLLKR